MRAPDGPKTAPAERNGAAASFLVKRPTTGFTGLPPPLVTAMNSRLPTARPPAALLLVAAGLAAATPSPAAPDAGAKVLIYTRNHVTGGGGYVHDNIAVSVAAVKELCAGKGIAAQATDNPAVFTPARLKEFRALLFCNSNNEAFSAPAQSEALDRFVRAGGGFVGIHSASGSERKNPRFKALLGGTFKWHTPHGPFTVRVSDPRHPATAHLPAEWKWQDEGYLCELVPGLRVLLEMDTTSVPTPPRAKWPLKFEGDRYPLAWCLHVGKGRSFYTALGHDQQHYADPLFRQHLLGGILWVLGRADASNNPPPTT